MFSLALPLLFALPIVLGGISPGQYPPFPTCDQDTDASARFSLAYSANQCMKETLVTSHIDMNSGACLNQPQVWSVKPDTGNDESGTYCLLEFVDGYCGCIRSSKKYELKKGEEPECLDLSPFGYAYSWFKTCDAHPDCPTGCFQPRQ